MLYTGALGGFVPYRDENLTTSKPNIFIAGDVAGVEEASAAMVEGNLAGLSAAKYLNMDVKDFEDKKADCLSQLAALRSAHAGERIKAGIEQAALEKLTN